MCCGNFLHVWNGLSQCRNHTSLRAVWQSYKGLLSGPMRKVARFRGPQSDIVWSSRVFPLWKYFMTWSQFWQGYPKSYYNYLTFWTVRLSFHSIISLRAAPPSPSVLYHLPSQAFIFPPLLSLTPVWDLAPHRLFMKSVCSAGAEPQRRPCRARRWANSDKDCGRVRQTRC